METVGPEALERRIAAWIDDLAEHARAAEAIASLGDTAIPPLRAYLLGEPQVIPQPRCFAVTMLARLHADAATEALREVLLWHPLRALDPRFAESEYVVKSEALDALAARTYAGLHEDIAFGISERLRVAVQAAGRFGFADLAPELVAVLDDDVLADAAVEALTAIGSTAADAILDRLDAWLLQAHGSARRRLAVLRALRVMHRLATPCADSAVIGHTLDDSHPAVRAAVALLIWSQRRDETIVEDLLHGALGFDHDLAEACREALEGAHEVLAMPATRALQRNAEPDLYGRQEQLTIDQRRWLMTCIHRE